MRLYVEKLRDRFPGGKLPAFLFYGFLLAYLGLHWGLEATYSFCWFKRITGVNCPTCGLSYKFAFKRTDLAT